MDGSAPFAFSLVSGSSPGGGVGSSIPRIGCQPDQSCVPGLESRLSREKLLISLYNEAYIVGATLSIDNHPELERTCPARIALRLLPSHSLLPAYCKASHLPLPFVPRSSSTDEIHCTSRATGNHRWPLGPIAKPIHKIAKITYATQADNR